MKKEISGVDKAVSKMMYGDPPSLSCVPANIATGLQNIGHNLQLVDSLSAIANRKGLTVAQLCIAWVGALGDGVIPLPGSS